MTDDKAVPDRQEQAKTVLWALIIVNGFAGPLIVKIGYENVPYILGGPRVVGMFLVGVLLASLYGYEWYRSKPWAD